MAYPRKWKPRQKMICEENPNQQDGPLSYAYKTSLNIVLALTTMYDVMEVSNNKRLKLEPLVYYDHTKWEIDVSDVVSIGEITRAKRKQCPLKVSFFLCNTVKSKTSRLWNKSDGMYLSHLEFTRQLEKELVLQFKKQYVKHSVVPLSINGTSAAEIKNTNVVTAWKVSKYGDFTGLYFLVFGLNTERYFVSLRI